jgi:hypothetical protein
LSSESLSNTFFIDTCLLLYGQVLILLLLRVKEFIILRIEVDYSTLSFERFIILRSWIDYYYLLLKSDLLLLIQCLFFIGSHCKCDSQIFVTTSEGMANLNLIPVLTSLLTSNFLFLSRGNVKNTQNPNSQSSTAPALVEIHQKIRNQKSILQIMLIN